LRTGYLDKRTEEEEKKLFEGSQGANVQQTDSVETYDNLKVDIINKSQAKVPESQEQFQQLNLSPFLLDNIALNGYQRLTIIQRHVIPIIQNRINLMACSQTGSGKTASFLIPIIQDLLQTGPPDQSMPLEEYKKNRRAYPIALILAPTRELALQIYDESRKFSHLTGIQTKVIYGGKDSYEQHRYLTWEGCDILVATPGRLIDFMEKFVDFTFLKFIVLDEADRMLDMGFEPQIREIMAKSFEQAIHKESVHVSMLSATLPKQVKGLAEDYLRSYVYIGVGNQGKSGSISNCIKQQLVDICNENKNMILFELISKIEGKILIFCGTKRALSNAYNYLNSKNLFVAQIHGDLKQYEREAELQLFKSKCTIMLATDVASRGLDISDVSYVINYDLPTNIESYVHRIGRTGRIGKTGTAISFIDRTDEPMYYKLYKVLCDSKQEIPKWFEGLLGNQIIQRDRRPNYNRDDGSYGHRDRYRGEKKIVNGSDDCRKGYQKAYGDENLRTFEQENLNGNRCM